MHIFSFLKNYTILYQREIVCNCQFMFSEKRYQDGIKDAEDLFGEMPVNDAEEAAEKVFRLQCKSNTCKRKKHWVGRISGCSGTLRKS